MEEEEGEDETGAALAAPVLRLTEEKFRKARGILVAWIVGWLGSGSLAPGEFQDLAPLVAVTAYIGWASIR